MLQQGPITFDIFLHELVKMFESPFIHAFIVLIFADFFLGYLKSYLTKTVNSRIGIDGILKHCTVMLLSLVFYYFTDIAQVSYLGMTFLSFAMIQYANSCAENWVSMGFPFPKSLQQVLDRLTDEQGRNINFKKKPYSQDTRAKIKKDDEYFETKKENDKNGKN